MLRIWPILFIVVPLVELYLIIKVGSLIGALWTVLLVLLTAVIGVQLLRIQGFSTLNRARHNMEMGVMPAMEMMALGPPCVYSARGSSSLGLQPAVTTAES